MRAYPKDAVPRMRYWVIFNNQLRFPPQVTRERWPDIMSRATIMATQTSTLNSMRHLYAIAELARSSTKPMCRCASWRCPNPSCPRRPSSFNAEVMNDLADIGEKMGADTASWRTEAP